MGCDNHLQLYENDARFRKMDREYEKWLYFPESRTTVDIIGDGYHKLFGWCFVLLNQRVLFLLIHVLILGATVVGLNS